jgi:hypothetical protein
MRKAEVAGRMRQCTRMLPCKPQRKGTMAWDGRLGHAKQEELHRRLRYSGANPVGSHVEVSRVISSGALRVEVNKGCLACKSMSFSCAAFRRRYSRAYACL